MTTLNIIKATGNYVSPAIIEVPADAMVPGGSTITVSGTTGAGAFSTDYVATEDLPAQFVTSNIAKKLNREVDDASFDFIESPDTAPAPVIALRVVSKTAAAVEFTAATIS